MTDKAPSMTEELDIGRLINITLPRWQVPTFASLTVRRSHTLVICLCVVCAEKTIAQPIYCKDIDLLAPDYRSAMPLQIGDTYDPTVAV